MDSINNKEHGHKCFYKYTSANVAKIALINRTIRWSSPIKFNDPFDVPRELILGFQEAELLEALVDEIGKIEEDPNITSFTGNPKLNAIVRMLRSIDSEKLRKFLISEVRKLAPEKADPFFRKPLNEFLGYWTRLIPQMRIICLSEVNDSMPMWSHYADNHQGVVLELDCIKEVDSPWLIARPVIYQDDPPLLAKETLIRSITGQQPFDYEQFCLDCMHIKTTDWAYEKEWRVVNFALLEEIGLTSDYPIHPLNFGSVYLGKEISKEDENDILAILNDGLSHMSAYKTVHNSRERRLQFEKIR